MQELIGRRNRNVATAALANQNARIAWALLARDRDYLPDDAAAQMAAQLQERLAEETRRQPPVAGEVTTVGCTGNHELKLTQVTSGGQQDPQKSVHAPMRSDDRGVRQRTPSGTRGNPEQRVRIHE